MTWEGSWKRILIRLGRYIMRWKKRRRIWIKRKRKFGSYRPVLPSWLRPIIRSNPLLISLRFWKMKGSWGKISGILGPESKPIVETICQEKAMIFWSRAKSLSWQASFSPFKRLRLHAKHKHMKFSSSATGPWTVTRLLNVKTIIWVQKQIKTKKSGNTPANLLKNKSNALLRKNSLMPWKKTIKNLTKSWRRRKSSLRGRSEE